jgi:hypothetical protein
MGAMKPNPSAANEERDEQRHTTRDIFSAAAGPELDTIK